MNLCGGRKHTFVILAIYSYKNKILSFEKETIVLIEELRTIKKKKKTLFKKRKLAKREGRFVNMAISDVLMERGCIPNLTIGVNLKIIRGLLDILLSNWKTTS